MVELDEETDKIQLIVPTKIRPEIFRLAHEDRWTSWC